MLLQNVDLVVQCCRAAAHVVSGNPLTQLLPGDQLALEPKSWLAVAVALQRRHALGPLRYNLHVKEHLTAVMLAFTSGVASDGSDSDSDSGSGSEASGELPLSVNGTDHGKSKRHGTVSNGGGGAAKIETNGSPTGVAELRERSSFSKHLQQPEITQPGSKKPPGGGKKHPGGRGAAAGGQGRDLPLDPPAMREAVAAADAAMAALLQEADEQVSRRMKILRLRCC